MNLDDYQDEWEKQPVDQLATQCQTIVDNDFRRRRRTVTWMAVFFVLSIASACHFFWASYVVRQEGILIALVRSGPFLFVAVMQGLVWRKLRREEASRSACSLDLRQCLTRVVGDLDQEIRELNPFRACIPLSLLVVFVGVSKWIDFQLGHDTAAECVAITIACSVILGLIPLGMWHYQQQFSIPRRNHIRNTLESLVAEEGS